MLVLGFRRVRGGGRAEKGTSPKTVITSVRPAYCVVHVSLYKVSILSIGTGTGIWHTDCDDVGIIELRVKSSVRIYVVVTVQNLQSTESWSVCAEFGFVIGSVRYVPTHPLWEFSVKAG